MQDLANIFIKSIFIDNMVFAYFLGMCSYLAISKTRRLPPPSKTKSKYIIAIRKAHKIHHKNRNKDHCINFGMLVVPWKYFK